MKKQSLFIILIIILALGVGIWRERSSSSSFSSLSTSQALITGTALPQAQQLPLFSLEDMEGNVFTIDSLKNHWTLLFFGYTTCPRLCPTTLSAMYHLSQRLNRFPLMQYVFITIDPENDDKMRLKTYLQQPLFGKNVFKGVTGDKQMIISITEKLSIHIERESNNNINHSGTLFLINPDGHVAAIFSESSQPHAIAHDIKQMIHHYAVTSPLNQARG